MQNLIKYTNFKHNLSRKKTEKAPINNIKNEKGDFSGGPVVKNRLPMQETQVQFLVREDPTC